MDDLLNMAAKENEEIKLNPLIKYIIEGEQSPNDPTDIKFDIQECSLSCDWVSYVKDIIFEKQFSKNGTDSDGKIRQTMFITYDLSSENQEHHSGTFSSNSVIQNQIFEKLNSEEELTDRNEGNPNQKEKLLELIMKINENFSNNVQTVKYYECLYCKFNTANKRSLMGHFRQQHESKGKRYVCHLCSFSSIYEEDLQEHYQEEHNQKKRVQWHKCRLCNYQSKSKKWLSKHLIRTHEPNKQPQLQKLSIHEANKQPQLYRCKFCNYVTKRKPWLKKHILKKHDSDKDIHENKCKFCHYTTKSKILLRRHIAKEHKLNCEPNVVKYNLRGNKKCLPGL